MFLDKVRFPGTKKRKAGPERIPVVTGSWAGAGDGMGNYEIYMECRKKVGFVLVYVDTHRDSLRGKAKEKTARREQILGWKYFRSHTVFEFSALLSRLSGLEYQVPDKEQYQKFRQMELCCTGAQIQEIRPPFPPKTELTCGASIWFGSYFQEDRAHKIPVEWQVLEVTEGIALLVACKGMVVSGYCDAQREEADPGDRDWAHSLARKVCNQEFYEQAFSEEEKECLVTRMIDGVRDPVFLLSESEATRFFPDKEQRRCEPTLYAQKQGAAKGLFAYASYTAWWLLTEGKTKTGEKSGDAGVICEPDRNGVLKAVFQDGTILCHSKLAVYDNLTLRPCILLDGKKLMGGKADGV